MPFLHERLPNGLDVIAETSESAVSTSVGFFVMTGSRDESDALWGTSHFLEHMIFKGTPEIPGDAINRRFDDMGASVNAFTSEEDTVYYASVLPEQQHEAVDLVARMMRPAHSIRGLPVAAMRDYHRRRYAPGTMVLAASGAVDFPALVESAKRLCGDWEPVTAPERLVSVSPRAAARPGRERIVRPAAALDYAVWMVAGPDEHDPDRHAARLLSVVLGDSSGSRLYWGLVDSGEAEQAACIHQDFLDAGVFITQLSCDAADVDELTERIAGIYATAASGGIPPAEFERAQNKLASRVVLGGEKPRRRLFEVGLDWSHCRTYRSVGDNLRIVEQITLDDVHRVLETWPLDAPAAAVVAGPGSGG